MHRVATCVCLALIMTVSGCARYVLKEPTRGVVAIPSSSNSWPFRMRDKAEELMSQHFPEGYVVESEGEAVIGETTDIEKTGFGGKRATTTDRTEWRIQYRSVRDSNAGVADITGQWSIPEVQPAGYENPGNQLR